MFFDLLCLSCYFIFSVIIVNNLILFNLRMGILIILGEIGKISEFCMINDFFFCLELIIIEYYSNISYFIYMYGWVCFVYRVSYVVGYLRILF